MSAWEKKLKHIELPAMALQEPPVQTWKKTGAVQELLKLSSLMITTPEEPLPLVEEVEPAVVPFPPLKQFKVRRGPLLEYDPNQPRLPKGTPTVGDKHAGEFTEDAEPVNHTGSNIATFDPLLMRKKKRGRVFKRKLPIAEGDSGCSSGKNFRIKILKKTESTTKIKLNKKDVEKV